MAKQAVYGIMMNREQAEKAIKNLIAAGLNPQDISLLTPHGKEYQDFKEQKNESYRNWRTEERFSDSTAEERYRTIMNKGNRQNVLKTENHTKAPEGATAGGVTGGIIGGTLGLLAGIGALAIPGLGPFIAAGPLLAALSGIGAGGTLGGIIGALVGAGFPETEAERLENALREGGVLLCVHVENSNLAKLSKDILKKQGAEDVIVAM